MDTKNSSRIMMISTHGYVSPSPEFGKPDTGGQVVYVLELSKWLARLGYRVDIYTRQFDQLPQVEEVESDLVRIIKIPCGGPDFLPKEWLCETIPEWIANAINYIRTQNLRYTAINSHYWDAGIAGQAIASQLHIPHLHTPHSIGSWKRENMPGSPEELERKYNFQCRISIECSLYSKAAGVIATTPLQREILMGAPYGVSSQKINLIPAGYDDSRFFPISGSSKQMVKRQLGLEGPIVLAIGRLARNKGYDLLIQAMKPVCTRIPETKLVLAIGSNSLNADEERQLGELKALGRSLDLEHQIDFRGYIADEDLPNMYRAADVFALSSRYEPFGMTAIESMACGVPTIVTTEGGLWEQVKWGVECLQYPEVADQLSLHGSAKARSAFTWSTVSQEFLRSCERTTFAVGQQTRTPHFTQSHSPQMVTTEGVKP